MRDALVSPVNLVQRLAAIVMSRLTRRPVLP